MMTWGAIQNVKSGYEGIVEAIEEKQAHCKKLGIFIDILKNTESLSQNSMLGCGAAWTSISL